MEFKNKPTAKEPTSTPIFSRIIAPAPGISCGANDHVRFVKPYFQVGDKISVDTTSPYTTDLDKPSLGRITLQPGTYHIRAAVLEIGTALLGVNGVIEAALRNADTGIYFTGTGDIGAGKDRYLLHDETVQTFDKPTRIEFAFPFATTLKSYGKAVIEINQLA